MRTYKTVQGDTWDSIAYSELGDELHMTALMQANPCLLQTVIFGAGVVLQIPEITEVESLDLPPWKRS